MHYTSLFREQRNLPKTTNNFDKNDNLMRNFNDRWRCDNEAQDVLGGRKSSSQEKSKFIEYWSTKVITNLYASFTFTSFFFQEMEKLVDAGLVKSIGLSNFDRNQVDRIIKMCNIKPVLLHLESTILNADQELIAYAQSFGIQVSVHDVAAPPSERFVSSFLIWSIIP